MYILLGKEWCRCFFQRGDLDDHGLGMFSYEFDSLQSAASSKYYKRHNRIAEDSSMDTCVDYALGGCLFAIGMGISNVKSWFIVRNMLCDQYAIGCELINDRRPLNNLTWNDQALSSYLLDYPDGCCNKSSRLLTKEEKEFLMYLILLRNYRETFAKYFV